MSGLRGRAASGICVGEKLRGSAPDACAAMAPDLLVRRPWRGAENSHTRCQVAPVGGAVQQPCVLTATMHPSFNCPMP
jgi:hypothetical protein